jgi:hypothetical protein
MGFGSTWVPGTHNGSYSDDSVLVRTETEG